MSQHAADHLDVALAESAADVHKVETQQHGVPDKVHPLGHLEAGQSTEKARVTEDEYGNVYPTEEELKTLRRLPESIPWDSMPRPVEADGTVHRSGAAMDLPQSGALDKGQRAATGLTTFNSFWVYVTPLIGAYLADAHLGRYKTICLAVAIATVGHALLTGSAAPDMLDNPNGALGLFAVSIVIMGVGTGFFKPNVSTLIAEQVKGKRQTIKTLKSGERVIVDPSLTIARLFMYFYAAINVGAIVGQVAMVYAEKRVGFWLSYLLPTVVFLLCVPVLLFSNKYYTKTPPAGSVLSDAIKFIRFATKGRWSLNPVRSFKNLTAADLWENAKPSKQTGALPSWMTFDDIWVDELRRAIKACQVFVFFPVYWLCYNQINNNLTSQAATMELHGLPNDLISNLDPLAILILIPILDLVVYPLFQKMGFNFTPLKRICTGFFCASFAMVWASVLQYYIYKKSPCGSDASSCATTAGDTIPAPINVWAQTGSYVLIALSELFASVTGLSYAFTKAPKNMKSIVMAVFLFMTALSNAIGEAFLSLAEDPNLIWNYGVFAVASFIAGILFWICFRGLDKEEDELNALEEKAAQAFEARLQDNGHRDDASEKQ
ncbi:unnamed protein product [Sympodiomycopsis kandeliae]